MGIEVLLLLLLAAAALGGDGAAKKVVLVPGAIRDSCDSARVTIADEDGHTHVVRTGNKINDTTVELVEGQGFRVDLQGVKGWSGGKLPDDFGGDVGAVEHAHGFELSKADVQTLRNGNVIELWSGAYRTAYKDKKGNWQATKVGEHRHRVTITPICK